MSQHSEPSGPGTRGLPEPHLVSDSLWIGHWHALRTPTEVTVTGPAHEPMPTEIAVFCGADRPRAGNAT